MVSIIIPDAELRLRFLFFGTLAGLNNHILFNIVSKSVQIADLTLTLRTSWTDPEKRV